MRSSKPLRFKFLALLISLTACLALLEGAIRALELCPNRLEVPPKHIVSPYEPNPFDLACRPYYHTQIPGSVYVQKAEDFEVLYQINSRGFRGPEIPSHAPEGKKRLLLIGDSMVEGHGVEFEETFAWMIRQALEPTPWESVSTGHRGYDIAHYAANMPRYLALNPDAAMIVFIDNDMLGVHYWTTDYMRHPYLDDPEALARGETNRGGPRLQTPTYFRRLARGAGIMFHVTPVEQIMIRAQERLSAVAENGKVAPFSYVREEEWPLKWSIAREYLDWLADEFESRGIELMAAHLPLTMRTDGMPKENRRHSEMMEHSLTEWAQQRDLPLLRFGPLLNSQLATKERPAILLPHDGHLSALGHRRIGEILLDWLAEQLQVAPSLLPSPEATLPGGPGADQAFEYPE